MRKRDNGIKTGKKVRQMKRKKTEKIPIHLLFIKFNCAKLKRIQTDILADFNNNECPRFICMQMCNMVQSRVQSHSK